MTRAYVTSCCIVAGILSAQAQTATLGDLKRSSRVITNEMDTAGKAYTLAVSNTLATVIGAVEEAYAGSYLSRVANLDGASTNQTLKDSKLDIEGAITNTVTYINSIALATTAVAIATEAATRSLADVAHNAHIAAVSNGLTAAGAQIAANSNRITEANAALANYMPLTGATMGTDATITMPDFYSETTYGPISVKRSAPPFGIDATLTFPDDEVGSFTFSTREWTRDYVLTNVSSGPGLPSVWTNMVWGAAFTNATYRMSWDPTNATFIVEEILP